MHYARVCDILFVERAFAPFGETIMTERDIMRLFEKYDGEVSMSDFTPDELADLIAAETEEELPVSFKEKYFSKYDDVKVAGSKKLSRLDW